MMYPVDTTGDGFSLAFTQDAVVSEEDSKMNSRQGKIVI
jgi:hypothetical protein